MPRITQERRQLWLNPRGTEAHRACLPLLLAPLGWGPWLLGAQDRRPWEHRTWLQVALNKRLSGGLSGRVLGVGRGQAPGSPPPVLTAPSQPRWGEGVEARAIPVLDTSPQPRPRGGLLCRTPALCACLALVGTLGSSVCVWSLGHRCSGFWFRAGRTSCWPLAFWVILFRFKWNLDNCLKSLVHCLKKLGYLLLPVFLKRFRRSAFEVEPSFNSNTFIQFHRTGFFCRQMILCILLIIV